MPLLLKVSNSSPDSNTDRSNSHNRQVINILQHPSHKEGRGPSIDDRKDSKRITKEIVRIQIIKIDLMDDKVMLCNVFDAEDLGTL